MLALERIKQHPTTCSLRETHINYQGENEGNKMGKLPRTVTNRKEAGVCVTLENRSQG